MLTAKELRKKYIEFFISKGHKQIPSASLIPENDPTSLFTTAGMQPLVPFLMGEKHPQGTKIVDIQKCIRTGDIEEVGDNRHLTFFEMMGNWSLGDYFKKEAIEWSWEFLTDPQWLGLDPKRLYVTVFKGENGIPRDEEAIKVWQEVLTKAGLEPEVAGDDEIVKGNIRIIPLGTEDNFWIAGATGPCGGDTEMFYDTRPEEGPLEGKFEDLIDSFRIMEIWNDVFMEFNKTAEGEYIPLDNKNVDTGMGVERTIMVLNGFTNVFETKLFLPIFDKIKEISQKEYQDNEQAFRVISDHIKAATMILGDEKGIAPSNVDQGYILRRLIRRAIRYGKKIGINETFTDKISEVIIDMYKDDYPEVETNKDFIFKQLKQEEEKFSKTLERGLKILNSEMIIQDPENIDNIPDLSPSNGMVGYTPDVPKGKWFFDLYQTHGFPLELALEELKNRGKKLKETEIEKIQKEFDQELAKHQEVSRKGSEQKFKGGLADQDGETTKLHTATHMLLAALRQVLNPDIVQKGSNITGERLRFDFNYDQKMTDEQKKQVEDIINAKISENIDMKCEEMTVEEAKNQGAIGVFESKYGEKVKVYSIGDYSKEICGGPHAENIGELGHFRIKKEESSSAGVRRIKAVLE